MCYTMKSVLYYVRPQRKYIKTNVYNRRIEPLYTSNQIYYMVHFTFVYRIKRRSNNTHCTYMRNNYIIVGIIIFVFCFFVYWVLILNHLLTDDIECISKCSWCWWSEVQYYIIVYDLSAVIKAVHSVFIISKMWPGIRKRFKPRLGKSKYYPIT